MKLESHLILMTLNWMTLLRFNLFICDISVANEKNYLNTRLQNGETKKTVRLRILPVSVENPSLYVEIETHKLRVDKQISESTWKNFVCLNSQSIPDKFPKEKCPICEKRFELFKEAIRPRMSQCENEEKYEESFKLYENNRETQPLNGRPVFYYDHYKACGFVEEKKKKSKEKGHYEKFLKSQTEYFYVDGQAPSGLPGSLVVSKAEAKRLKQ